MVFQRAMGETMLDYFRGISDAAVEPLVKERVEKFRQSPYTDAQLYDFICSIGDMPVEPIFQDGKKVAVIGYIDGFTKALCELRKYYQRPDET